MTAGFGRPPPHGCQLLLAELVAHLGELLSEPGVTRLTDCLNVELRQPLEQFLRLAPARHLRVRFFGAAELPVNQGELVATFRILGVTFQVT